ncbi:hypothetical protein cypCar_00047072, partial [Cyprinus carpio]
VTACRSGSTVSAAPASPVKASARLVSVCAPTALTRTGGSSQGFPAAVLIISCRFALVTDARIPAPVWPAASASRTTSLCSAPA